MTATTIEKMENPYNLQEGQLVSLHGWIGTLEKVGFFSGMVDMGMLGRKPAKLADLKPVYMSWEDSLEDADEMEVDMDWVEDPDLCF